MGADGAGSVRVGAAEPELHPGAEVAGRPVGVAVVRHGLRGGPERAVGIRRAGPDMADVEMGVDVGKTRPHLPAVDIAVAGLDISGGPRDVGYATVRDGNVDSRETLGIDLEVGIGVGNQGARHARVPQCKCRHGRHFPDA